MKIENIKSNITKLYRHLENILNIKENPQPISLVVDLTGKCNWNCEFCYIKNRDRNSELDFDKLIDFIDVINPKSVELTGGEPCLYSRIDNLMLYLHMRHIKMGMFTNGSEYWRLHYPNLLKWVRVSVNKYIDENIRFTDPPYPERLGYSYIVHENSPDDWKDRINKFIESHRGDYIKITSDINHQINIDYWWVLSPKIIIQKPVEFQRYKGKCYMGFLKPYLNADGQVYACVGTVKDFKRDTSKAITNIDRPHDLLRYYIFGDKEVSCDNCRFADRNKFIDFVLEDEVEDEDFI